MDLALYVIVAIVCAVVFVAGLYRICHIQKPDNYQSKQVRDNIKRVK